MTKSFQIECVNVFTRGFVVGGDNLTMYVYYTHENNGVMTFERAQTLSIKPASELERVSIKNLVIDVENEDSVICITTTRQIYEVKIRNEALMGMFVDKTTHWTQIGKLSTVKYSKVNKKRNDPPVFTYISQARYLF